MIPQILVLSLALASPGARARPGIQPSPENAARARSGLLPRKVVRARPPGRARRIVLVPQAPTWLGEPGEVEEPLAEPAVEASAEATAPATPRPAVAVAVEPTAPVAAQPAMALAAEPALALAAQPAMALAAEPAAALLADAEVPDVQDDGPFRVAVDGVQTEAILVRRLAAAVEHVAMSAAVAGAQVEAAIVRR